MIARQPTDLRSILALFVTPQYGPFLWATGLAIGPYAVILIIWTLSRFFAIPALDDYLRVMTVLCCIGMAAHVVTGLNIIRQNDEFMRALIGKRVTIAAYLTFGILTIWGLLTNIGAAPQFPLLFAYMLFIAVHTALIPFINANRP